MTGKKLIAVLAIGLGISSMTAFADENGPFISDLAETTGGPKTVRGTAFEICQEVAKLTNSMPGRYYDSVISAYAIKENGARPGWEGRVYCRMHHVGRVYTEEVYDDAGHSSRGNARCVIGHMSNTPDVCVIA